MSARPGAVRRAVPVAALAAVCYIPLLLTNRGKVGADTKTYLYLDPDRLMERAPAMWDPHIGLGTVTHQNIGYLWPMGPFYWLFDHLGFPDWVAQRLWLGSIMFLAGVGVRYLLRTLGQSGPQITPSMFLYALSPYVLTLGARLSVILLCFTGLPWLLALAIRSGREGGWVHPALFALVVTTIGSTNATALVLVGIAPALWFPFAVLVHREIPWRSAAAAVARIGVLTVGCSLWWMAGLWAQGAYGIEILRYTETARTVSEGATAPEALRGLGYWFFYGNDKFGSWVAASRSFTQNPFVITLSYLLPITGLLVATAIRWRYRAYFVSLIVVGVVLAVGAHPWSEPTTFSGLMKEFLSTDTGFALRSLPRVVPLVALGMSVLLGSGIAALGARWQGLLRPLSLGLTVVAVLNMPPLWQGQLVDDNLQRDEDLPAYWHDSARWLDGRDTTAAGWRTRVLEVPGSDFASYRWGNTVDPVLPGLMDRPYVARELIPYGSPASAALLNAIDARLQTGLLEPEAVAPLARLLSAGDIVLRGDLTYERYKTARPRQVFDLLNRAEGLSRPRGFGSNAPNIPSDDLPMHDELELTSPIDLPNPWKVTVFPVSSVPALVRALPADTPVIVDGDGEGLVDLAQAGLLRGDELVLFAATLDEDPQAMDRELGREGAVLVLTDSNRKMGWRWSTMYDNAGFTETAAGGVLREDPTDNRLPVFPEVDDSGRSIVEYGSGVSVRATSYGNPVTFTPDNRPALALDDDPESEWATAGFSASDRGDRIVITYDSPRTTDRITLQQADNGVQNRWVQDIRIRLDDREPFDARLGEPSKTAPGEVVELPEETTFSRLEIEILGDDLPFRYDFSGLSGIGFSDIRLGDDDIRVDEVVRLPQTLLGAAGAESLDRPLVVSLTRLRVDDSLPLRTDAEDALRRSFELPTARSFSLTGEARVDFAASEEVIDELYGLAGAGDGGVTATSKRRLAGDVRIRASSAIDGDLETVWSPGFLEQEGDWMRFQTAEPLSFDHLELQVLADGWHTVPRRIRIEAEGEEAVEAEVQELEDGDRGTVRTVGVDLPRTVTGTDLTITFPAVREVETPDWVWGQDIVMPMGIAELGIPGLAVEPSSEPFDSGCRTDLLQVGGEPLGVRITGSRGDVDEGRPLDLATCDGSALDLDRGETVLRTVDGRKAGISIDQVILRSEAGGGPATDPTATLTPDVDEAPVRVSSEGATELSVTMPTHAGETWLVLGQSLNAGWHAKVDGRDLGEPTLVSGYANGWLLPADASASTVTLEWAPQRTVRRSLLASLVVALGCLAIIVVGTRRRAGRVAPPSSGEQPSPFALSTLWRSSGAPPSLVASGITVALSVVAGYVFIGLPAGLVLGLIALAVTRVRRARALTVLGPSALLGVYLLYVLYAQVRFEYPAGFSWPSLFHKFEALGYLAVLVVVLEVVVERLWTGRFSPGRRTPTAPD